jgi:hypothetical protein
MSTAHKPPKKQISSRTDRVIPRLKKGAQVAKQGEYEVISPGQLKEAGRILGRIERKGEALSANADRLLKRVSWAVAKTPIGDTLIRALATVDELQETVGKHAQVLNLLTDKMAEMDKRLAVIEKAIKSWAGDHRRNGPRASSLSA